MLASWILTALASLGAQAGSQPDRDLFAALPGHQLSEASVFNGPIRGNEGDRRRYLFQFGLRPTLVLAPMGELRSTKISDEAAKKALVHAYKRLDSKARAWKAQGLEVLCLHPGYVDGTRKKKRGERFPELDIGSLCRPRNMAIVQDDWDVGYLFTKSSQTLSAVLSMLRTGESGFAWMLMLEPGTVAQCGRGVEGGPLRRAIAELPPPPFANDRAARLLLDAIAEYRLDEAALLLAKAQAEEESEAMQQLGALLRVAERHYTAVLLEPYLAKGMLPDYVEGIETAVRLHWQGRGRGEELLREMAELRADEEFEDLLEQRKKYRAVLALQERNEDAAWKEYGELSRRRDVSDAELNQIHRKHHETTLAAWHAWLEEHRTSPYRGLAGLEYLDLQDRLRP